MLLPFISLVCSFISGQFILRRFTNKSLLFFFFFGDVWRRWPSLCAICRRWEFKCCYQCCCCLRLPCGSCPFPAAQRSLELQQDRGAGGVCQGWGLAPTRTLAADLCVILVPAGESVNREPSSHTHIIVGLCSCLFFALGAFLHGHLAGELPVWCQGQVCRSLCGQSNMVIASSTESRSLEEVSVDI